MDAGQEREWGRRDDQRTRRHTRANSSTSSTQIVVSSRMGGRGAVLRRTRIGMCSGTGVCTRDTSDGVGAGVGVGRTSSSVIRGATGGSGVDGREGLAGMSMEPALTGRTGLGAINGGLNTAGWMKGGGSATVVAVDASRMLRACSTACPGEDERSGIDSVVGI